MKVVLEVNRSLDRDQENHLVWKDYKTGEDLIHFDSIREEKQESIVFNHSDFGGQEILRKDIKKIEGD